MTTPDYRAFLESFIAAEDLILPGGPVSWEHQGEMQAVAKLFTRARTLLAAPEVVDPPMPLPGDAEGLAEVFWGRYEAATEAVGVADEELLALRSWSSHGPTFDSDLVDFARAVLARYGTAHPAPVPVAPTDEELLGSMLKAAASVPGGQCTGILDWDKEAIAAARAVLARWGHPSLNPQ